MNSASAWDRLCERRPSPEIAEILRSLVHRIDGVFGERLVGVYLTGSLSYGGFDEGRSDIDLAVVLFAAAAGADLDLIRGLHVEEERAHPAWAGRIECSYIPRAMLAETLPPRSPRPYFGSGRFWAEAPYGNEWLINLHFLATRGIALHGPAFRSLVDRVEMEDVVEASLRDLHAEWEPKLVERGYLRDPHQQSYLVLNLCRILYTALRRDAVSKPVAAAWVGERFPRWAELIATASRWRYGVPMDRDDEVLDFLRFVLAEAR